MHRSTRETSPEISLSNKSIILSPAPSISQDTKIDYHLRLRQHNVNVAIPSFHCVKKNLSRSSQSDSTSPSSHLSGPYRDFGSKIMPGIAHHHRPPISLIYMSGARAPRDIKHPPLMSGSQYNKGHERNDYRGLKQAGPTNN